ncbi:MAG: RNA polymerase sigma factor [Candidatus Hydrogenedentota bacterium]
MTQAHDKRNEAGLTDAARIGSEAAWRDLYHRYFDRLYGFVFLRAGRHVQRTEEVVQESWMTAVRKIRQFDPNRGSFEAWLFGIAQNTLLNHRRKWRRSNTEEIAYDHSATDQARGTEIVQTRELVGLTLSGIPMDYADILRAKYTEGYSVAEISATWKRSEKAVESLLTRARNAFKEEYRRLEDDDYASQ